MRNPHWRWPLFRFWWKWSTIDIWQAHSVSDSLISGLHMKINKKSVSLSYFQSQRVSPSTIRIGDHILFKLPSKLQSSSSPIPSTHFLSVPLILSSRRSRVFLCSSLSRWLSSWRIPCPGGHCRVVAFLVHLPSCNLDARDLRQSKKCFYSPISYQRVIIWSSIFLEIKSNRPLICTW